jgi:hypothetical protein
MTHVSMSEERFPGDLLESRPSSTKVALGVAGIVIGLGVLVCGGVAGYVAITTTETAVVEAPAPAAPDSGAALQSPQHIIEIDLPAGFEPLSRDGSAHMRIVEFGRKDVDATSLTLARVDLIAIPSTNPDEVRSRMLEMLDKRGRRGNVMMKVDPLSPSSTREFTLLRQKATFQIVDGTLTNSGTSVRRISGVFRTRNAHVALAYTVPTAEYDEETFLKMLESIRPSEGDSMLDAADGSGENVSPGTEEQSPAGESDDAEKPHGSE